MDLILFIFLFFVIYNVLLTPYNYKTKTSGKTEEKHVTINITEGPKCRKHVTGNSQVQ